MFGPEFNLALINVQLICTCGRKPFVSAVFEIYSLSLVTTDLG